jgi:hypothetical protein
MLFFISHAVKALRVNVTRHFFIYAGEGVGVSVSALKEDTHVYAVEYCAYSHARRTIFSCSTDGFNAGKFEVLTESDQSGIKYKVLT